ncbi:MAG: CvpA family protein [Bacilli bacterium]|nr:CvpA family protein [Bacilli bacterium]
MGKIDIGIYILILIMIIIGFSKGFFKQILSTANWLVSLILAIVFVKPFSNLMGKTALQTTIDSKVGEWIASKGGALTIPYEPSNGNAQISEAISEILKLPKFVADLIAGGLDFNVPEGTTLVDILTPAIGTIIMTALSFIILFIGLLIILKIVINLFNVVFDRGVLGIFNKILGAALGLAKGLILISLAMLLLSTISGVIPSLNEFIITDLKLGEEGFSIGKYFYESNPLIALFKGSFSFDDILNELNLTILPIIG